MISSSYVNGSNADIKAYDPFNIFESDINIILDTLNTAYLEYKEAIDEYNLSVEFFEASDDTKKDNVVEKQSNFVDRIGKAIIEIGKKAIAFINNIIAKIQESTFGNKTDMEKVAALCKKNPTVADDINKAFREGNLQVADLKNIKELEQAYEECLRLARQENVDPNTIKGKWATAKRKFGDLSESDIIKGTVTVLSVAGSVASIGVSVSKIMGTVKSCKEGAAKAANAAEAAADAAVIRENMLKVSNANAKKAEHDAGTAEANHVNAKLRLAKTAESFVKNAGKPTRESYEFEIDDNGYMTESASSTIGSIIASIESDMMRVYTVISKYNYNILGKIQAIFNGAIKGYNKPVKNTNTDSRKEDDEEE